MGEGDPIFLLNKGPFLFSQRRLGLVLSINVMDIGITIAFAQMYVFIDRTVFQVSDVVHGLLVEIGLGN